jgi:hypothetical protein
VATAISNAALATSAQSVAIIAAVAAAGGAGSVEQTIRIHDGDGNPVAGVMVVAQGNNGGTQTTNNGGGVVLMLNPDTYVLTLQGGPGYVYDNPRALIVTDGEAQTFDITAINPPSPASPGHCGCYRDFEDTAGAEAAGFIRLAELTLPEFPAPLVAGGAALVVGAVATGTGRVTLELPVGAAVVLALGTGDPAQEPGVKLPRFTVPGVDSLDLGGDLPD